MSDENPPVLAENRIPPRLRAVREMKDLSQREVANAAGLSTQQVSLGERGLRTIGIDELGKWASAFGVHPFELLADRPLRVTQGWVQ